jgi:hypothetical protein
MTERWRRVLGRLDTVNPSPGLWETAQARAEEGWYAEERGDLVRRALAAALAAIVAGAGLVVVFRAFRGQETQPRRDGIVIFRDPTGAWEIAYPDRFMLGAIPAPSEPPRVMFEGIWIANFDPPRFPDFAQGPLPFEFPDDEAMVVIYQSFGGPPFIPRDPDTTPPITFDDLKVVPGEYPGVWRTDTVVANGEPYTVTVRMGPTASQEDREAVANILSSLRFLPLQEGTAIGRHLTFYVLGLSDLYPVGSVTRFDRSNLPSSDHGRPFPLYVVHVPEGFYALAWLDHLRGGYKDCDVTYDPAAREFSCPNGARWDLDGSVIAKPGPGFPDDPLEVLLVRISLDGQVLVSPNVFMPDTSLDLQMTGG